MLEFSLFSRSLLQPFPYETQGFKQKDYYNALAMKKDIPPLTAPSIIDPGAAAAAASVT